MAQLTYNYTTAKAVAGQKADLRPDVVVSRRNEAADGKMMFGMACVVGTSKGVGVALPAATTDTFEGVVVHSHTTESQFPSGKVVVVKGATLGVMTHGAVWGRIAADVTPVYGAKAYVIVTGDEAGCFTTSSTGTLDVGATFGNATDDGIAIINL